MFPTSLINRALSNTACLSISQRITLVNTYVIGVGMTKVRCSSNFSEYKSFYSFSTSYSYEIISLASCFLDNTSICIKHQIIF